MSEYLDGFFLWKKAPERIIQTGSARDLQRMKEGTCMKEQGCSISEAAKQSGVESYVLRYWEEEGILHVRRNRKGHRCYTEAEFAQIREIQRLKEEGLSLKEIREQQIQTEKEAAGGQEAVLPAVNKAVENKEKTEACFSPAILEVSEKQKKQQLFFQILERVTDEVAMTRSREERYRKLDEAIRRQQKTRRMIAATREEEKTEHHRR